MGSLGSLSLILCQDCLKARTGLTAAVGPDGRIYAIGGRNASGPLKTVEAYDPRTNTWTPLHLCQPHAMALEARSDRMEKSIQ
ncbi:Kelch repeat-containing protein [Ktedonobacter racemifer]|uniref:Kelch repeat-containing protein n=1 Tax=Ktedonobacter racemifer TaxID=363277 RepID=UPI003B75B715